jgi:DNA-binding SARP family transcriptional activator/tetratricopeptide (TPR) repeat protein
MHRLLLFRGAFLEGPDGPLTGRAAYGHRLALLARLAAEHPRPLTRDRLIALLWPESNSERGRRMLRHALHLLRAAVGEETVLSRGDELRLSPERLSCDLWEFREALDGGDLEAGVAAYGGPFLHGIFLDGADEFERWVEVERSRLAACFAEALAALAEQHEAAGELRPAAAAWQRLSEHDRYNSRVVLRLMQALAATGDRAGALRHAETHAALLRTEFGAEPDPDVAALAVRLREQPVSLAAQPTSGYATVPTGEAAGTGIPPAEASDPRSAAPREIPVPGAPVVQSVAPPVAQPGAEGATTRFGRRSAPPRVRMFVLGGVVVFGLLGMLTTGDRGELTLALLGFGPPESLLRRGVLAERERILVADFTSPTGDTVLAGMATVAFRIDLAQSPILRLVEPQQVQDALARMEYSDVGPLDPRLAREVALREGIKAVLSGEVVRSGGGYLLSAQLLVPGSGEILAAHRETARDSSALLPALDRLSKQLRRQIGESLRSVRSDPPLAQVTTSSLAALRKYSQAHEILSRERDHARAIALLEEAIALDTTFAMAYLSLSVALGNLADQPARQIELVSQAYRHRDRLTERERYRLLAEYHGFVSFEPEKSIAALRSLLETDPDDDVVLNGLGVFYARLGDYARAEELTRLALAVDSGHAIVLDALGMWQYNQGRLEEAEVTFRRFAARFPDSPVGTMRALHLAAGRGDYAAAEAHAQAWRTATREDLLMQVLAARHQVDLASLRGSLREAERHVLEVDELSRRRGLPSDRLRETLHLAHLEVAHGRSAAGALARVEQAVTMIPLSELSVQDRPYADLAALYARAGQPGRARALLEEWEAAVPSALRHRRGQVRARPFWGTVLQWVLGEIALAEGRPDEAAHQFRQANHAGCLICTLPHLGRAYEAAGQPDSAIAVYERYLRTPFAFRLFYDAEWRAPVLERLGQLHETRGDRARAAAHYRRFVELWQDADPDLQPRVREARRRLAAMR